MKPIVALRLICAVGLILALGPVPELGAQSADGQASFEGKCIACHTTGADRLVGPGLAGITERRDRAWLISFITNPDGMIADGDPIAADLLAEYQVPMPNLGITSEEAEAILSYVEGAGGGEPAAGQADTPAEPLPKGDLAVGRDLFSGEIPLENGGASCVSCHSVGGLEGAGGGTLAVDLSKVETRYGDALAGVLATLPFPVMQDIFADKPLTDQERADLTAYFSFVDQMAPSAEPFLAFPAAGLGGAFVVLLMFGFLGRRRLKGVREPLIGGHR